MVYVTPEPRHKGWAHSPGESSSIRGDTARVTSFLAAGNQRAAAVWPVTLSLQLWQCLRLFLPTYSGGTPKLDNPGHRRDTATLASPSICPLPGGSCCCLFTRSVISDSLWPHDCSTPGFPVFHCLPEFAQTDVHWVSDAVQPSPPPSSPSPVAVEPATQETLGMVETPTTPVPKRCHRLCQQHRSASNSKGTAPRASGDTSDRCMAGGKRLLSRVTGGSPGRRN